MPAKPTKMSGGLIRREPRVARDRNGNTTVQHWDGRKDVTVAARPANTRAVPNTPGEK
jgi:hypothetical protein